MTERDTTPWTWRQFCTAMRNAGWKNGGQGWFVHEETGAQFYGWTGTAHRLKKYGRAEAWWPYALERVTPTEAPF